MWKTVIALLVLNILVFLHEFGHFVMAKLIGIAVEEFAIGFGPRLFGFKKGETRYSLRLFPLGGFCKLKGEDEAKGEAIVDEPDSYYAKPVQGRFAVIVAGPLMNLLAGILIFILLYAVVTGTPQLSDLTIDSVVPGSTAEQLGLREGDVLLAIDSIPLKQWSDITAILSSGNASKLTFKRGDTVIEVMLPPGTKALGITPVYQKHQLPEAITCGVQQAVNVVSEIYNALPKLVTNESNDIVGPLGLIKIVGDFLYVPDVFSYIVGLISVNLAIMNLLPIPGLDGGRLMLLVMGVIWKKPVDRKLEAWANYCGLALLFALMIAVMYQDIVRFML